MIAADVFRQRFETARVAIADWIAAHRDVADIAEELTPTFWRLAATPHAAQTCPFELIVHTGSQQFDLDIGPETYRGRPAPPCEDLPRIVSSIAAGEVVIRTHRTVGTGAPLWSETTIGAPVVIWHGERSAPGAPPTATGEQSEARERRYVRYRL